ASRRAVSSAIVSSRQAAIAAKCASSAAISAGSALAASRSGRSKAPAASAAPYPDSIVLMTRITLFRSFLAPAGNSAAPGGPCRKPPSALYVESGEEWVTSRKPPVRPSASRFGLPAFRARSVPPHASRSHTAPPVRPAHREPFCHAFRHERHVRVNSPFEVQPHIPSTGRTCHRHARPSREDA